MFGNTSVLAMGQAKDSEEKDEVLRARRGDRLAFEELFRRTHRPLYGFIRRMVRSEEDARDLTQETYLEAWRSLPRLRDAGSFRSWLYRIALNKTRDFLKRRRVPTESLDERLELHPGDEPPDPAPDLSAGLLDEERRDQVRHAFEEMTEEHRAVMALHYGAGLGVGEMAQTLALPKGTVVSRLSRARDALRRRLAATMEELDEV